MVPLIGTVHDYAKGVQNQANLRMKQRELSLQSAGGAPNAYAQFISQLRQQTETVKKGMIDLKLKSGKRLSAAEMEYLRKNDPDMYAKAVRIAREREAYEKELRNCRTKQDVQRLRLGKMSSLMSELNTAAAANDTAAAEEIQMRASAIGDEHGRFVGSKTYMRLPKDDAEYAERKRRGDQAKGIAVGLYVREIPVKTEWLRKTPENQNPPDEADTPEPDPYWSLTRRKKNNRIASVQSMERRHTAP